MEEDLKNRVKLYSQLINSMSGMFQIIELIYDATGKPVDYYYRDVNPAFEKSLGKTRDQLINKRAKDIFGVVEKHWLEECEKIIKTGTSSSIENYGSEQKKYFRTKSWKVSENLVATTFDDITEHKQIELDLIKAKEKAEKHEVKLKTALESMSDAIFISDLEGNFIDFNEAFATFHKFKNKEECAKTLKEYPVFLDVFKTDGEFVPLEMWVVPKALRGETGLNKEYVLKRKDTAETWVGSYNYSPIRNNDSDIIGSVVTARDITDLKKSQKEIKIANEKAKKSKERFELAMAATKDGLYDWNLVTDEIYYSPGWKSMLGYQDDELPNDFSTWEQLTKKEDSERSWKMQQELISKQRDRFELEFKMKHKNGRFVDILSRAEAVFDKNGKAIRIVGTHVDITAIKQAEESNRLHSEMLANIADGVYLVKLDDGKIVYTNPRFEEMFGYDKAELIGKHVSIVNAPTDKNPKEIAEGILDSIKVKGTWQGEIKNIKKDKTHFWCSANVSLFNHSEYGEVLVTVHSDITERKNAEEKLHESQEIFRNFMEHSPIYVFFKDENIRAIQLSKNYESMLNKPLEEMLGKNMDDLFPSDLAKNMVADDIQLLKENKELRVEEELNGRFYTTIKFPIHIEGKPPYLAGYTIDITEQKLGELALKKSKDFIDSIIEQSPSPLWISDKKGILIRINPACAKLLNIAPKEVIGKYNILEDNLIEEQGHLPLVRDVFKKGKTAHFELKYNTAQLKHLKLKESANVILDATIFPIKDEKDNITNAVIQHFDITKRKIAEEEIMMHRECLEELVKERTKNLEEKNKELERFNNLFVDREIRIKELKIEIERLKK